MDVDGESGNKSTPHPLVLLMSFVMSEEEMMGYATAASNVQLFEFQIVSTLLKDLENWEELVTEAGGNPQVPTTVKIPVIEKVDVNSGNVQGNVESKESKEKGKDESRNTAADEEIFEEALKSLASCQEELNAVTKERDALKGQMQQVSQEIQWTAEEMARITGYAANDPELFTKTLEMLEGLLEK
eukprot:TRINITY_DN4215_c1_g2_i1.p1 TRINITY_DN4215_c1_g2~~TRINITY_DN4215_c1_g2_i1.p1  ORF type:complete len:186 (+),score=70.19 TRINITY_DN4215_c1_g2_i1:68-625(+)